MLPVIWLKPSSGLTAVMCCHLPSASFGLKPVIHSRSLLDDNK
jgi:hypothetical protein